MTRLDIVIEDRGMLGLLSPDLIERRISSSAGTATMTHGQHGRREVGNLESRSDTDGRPSGPSSTAASRSYLNLHDLLAFVEGPEQDDASLARLQRLL